ncbi:unnamed protein product [Kuraishia capsulata CBS 1993]|uniref:Nucleolar complex-associated protein 3 n=1 Tax=Kuraishia capsulata CBS 1993 TaxID=1382522 RepID=W6MK78_9ASCO|nr:uncharacterized protein KUCA_T00002720001 [Kuraishia capsulata CBS 1993]CDK26746.1 unnamed protein product [Kuraishia capsulata CBS 1993]
MSKRKALRKKEELLKKRKKQDETSLSSGVFRSLDGASDEEQNWSDEEQDYEMKPRSIYNTEQMVEGLPIKSQDGNITRVLRKQPSPKKKEEPVESSEEEPEEQEEDEENTDSDEDDGRTPQEKLRELKEEVANLSEELINDPEENINMLSRLRRMAESKNPNTSKLSLLSLVLVFRSIAPSYKIRPLTDAEKKEKVSREVKKQREFEQIMVANYKSYLQLLGSKARNVRGSQGANESDIELGNLAVKAACELTSSMKYFNFREELFDILVRRAVKKPTDKSSQDYKSYERSVITLQQLLLDDAERGDISFDIVRSLCHAIKGRKHRVDESCLNIFQSLTVLTDYNPNNVESEDTPRLKKKDRVHFSKKERKARKERKKIDAEIQSAEHALTVEQRQNFQAQILQMLLALYLEILRSGTKPLMAAVLEGLSMYTHMVNMDLLGDFLTVLWEFTTKPGDLEEEDSFQIQVRESLLAIVTAFALVDGQPKNQMDLSKFVDNLYFILAPMAYEFNIEGRTTRLIEDQRDKGSLLAATSVNFSTMIELCLRALEMIFFKSKSSSVLRAHAFTKRLYLSLLNLPEKSSIAILKFLGKLMSRYSEVSGLFSTEDRINDGVYHVEATEPARANPGAAVLWETVLLEKHYCPQVAQTAKSLSNKAKQSL